MDFSQFKASTLYAAVLTLVGCSTASKTTEYIQPAPLQVVSMGDDAQPGDRVLLPTNSGLGRDSVVVDQSYISASGRQCRRLRTVDGRLIQRVACQVNDGVWSLARDLRPISSTDSAVSGISAVRRTSELNQPLVPSVGSAMLLNEQDSLPDTSISPDNVEALVTSAAESLMQASAAPPEIGFAEPAMPVSAEPVIVVAAEYAEPVEAMPAQLEVADASLQPSDGSLISSSDEFGVVEYTAPAEIIPAQTSVADVPIAAKAQPLITSSNEFVVEEYAAPVEVLAPQIGIVVESSMQARAEALIISPEQHSEQVGVPLLAIGSNDSSAPVSYEPLARVADELEIETVQRTVNLNETLWSFAKRTTGNALNWEKIARLNGISEPKTLANGTQLQVPAELVGQGD